MILKIIFFIISYLSRKSTITVIYNKDCISFAHRSPFNFLALSHLKVILLALLYDSKSNDYN